MGNCSRFWEYHDAAGAVVGMTVRWDKRGKKEIRPIALVDGKWLPVGMPTPRPLYGLPAIASAELVLVTEGEKAADAARKLGFVVTTSAHGAGSAKESEWTPLAGKNVVILPDNNAVGEDYARDVLLILQTLEPPAIVKVVRLPGLPDGGDVADLVRESDQPHNDALRNHIDDLIANESPCGAILAAGDSDDRHVVVLDDSQRFKVTDQSVGVIASRFFQYGNEVVLLRKSVGGTEIAVATPEAIDDALNRLICFKKRINRKNGDVVEVDTCAPAWLAKQISKLQEWPGLRRLRAIHRGPFLRHDGSVGGLRRGYDEASECYVDTDEDWSDLELPPTAADIEDAVKRLDELVSEFPFSSRVSVSVLFASIMSKVARLAYRGSAPLFLFEATTPGSGKTLLAKIVSVIAEGERPGVSTLSSDDEEVRKTITSLLMEGSGFILFDNVTGGIHGASLDRLLTAEVWKDRRLGTNQTVSIRNDAVVLVTSNNASFSSDTARRTLKLKLAPLAEQPGERQFKIPDILNHVRENRAQYLRAIIKILQYRFIVGESQREASGDDVENLPAFGSYEDWSRVVRQAILLAGLPDPVLSRDSVKAADKESENAVTFLHALWTWDRQWLGTSRQLIEAVFEDPCEPNEARLELQHAIQEFAGIDGKRVKDPGKLGTQLSRIEGRVFAGLRVKYSGRAAGGLIWTVERVSDV